jgi:hypothetical protein
LTRSQRAGKGAEQSAARSGDHVVQRGCVRLFLARFHPVMLGNLAVDTKQDGLILGGDSSLADLAPYGIQLDPRDVGYV